MRWGTRPSFDKTTGAMLQKFYHTWYAPNNAIFVIVGDVQPEATLATVRRLFESIPPKKLPRRPTFEFESGQACEDADDRSDLSYGMAVITFRMRSQTMRKDDAATQVLGDVVVEPSR